MYDKFVKRGFHIYDNLIPFDWHTKYITRIVGIQAVYKQ